MKRPHVHVLRLFTNNQSVDIISVLSSSLILQLKMYVCLRLAKQLWPTVHCQINFASSPIKQPSVPSTTLVVSHASRIWNAIGTKLLESMVQIVLDTFRVGEWGTVGPPREVSVLYVPGAACKHSTVIGVACFGRLLPLLRMSTLRRW